MQASTLLMSITMGLEDLGTDKACQENTACEPRACAVKRNQCINISVIIATVSSSSSA